MQLYKQHFASEGGDDDEDDGDGMDGEGIADLAPSANKKRLVRLQAVLESLRHWHRLLLACPVVGASHRRVKTTLHEALEG